MGRRIASGMSRRASIPAAVSLTMIANVPRSARARRMPVARRKKEIEVKSDAGVLITSVDPGSAAEDAGLTAGMVIAEVNRVATKSVDDLRKAVDLDWRTIG